VLVGAQGRVLHGVGVDIAGCSGIFLGVAQADAVFPNYPAAAVLPVTIVPVLLAANVPVHAYGKAPAVPILPAMAVA